MVGVVSILRKGVVGAVGGLTLTLPLLYLPPVAPAGASSSVVPVTTFTVTPGPSCASGTQSPLLQPLQDILAPGPSGIGINLPPLSPNGSCGSQVPSVLSSSLSVSNTISSSTNGSATITSEAKGNVLFAEEATASLEITGSVPLSGPASSVDVTIPYTTSGVSWSDATGSDQAGAGLTVYHVNSSIMCADGSYGFMSPPIFQPSQNGPVPAGSGTLHFTYSCSDGSDVVSGVTFTALLDTLVYSQSGHTESATTNIAMSGVTAAINS